MKKAFIVSKLQCDLSQLIEDASFKIACDAGYLNFKRYNLQPDLLIGDFDSIPSEFLSDIPNKIQLNPIKDVTDTEYALNYLMDNKFDDITILGAIGGRLDMTLTTIALLAKASVTKIKIRAFFDDEIIFPLYNSQVTFKKEASGFISVFSYLNEARGVDEINFKYQLKNHTLQNTSPLGVSNEFINKEAYIKVKEGILIIITKRTNI